MEDKTVRRVASVVLLLVGVAVIIALCLSMR